MDRIIDVVNLRNHVGYPGCCLKPEDIGQNLIYALKLAVVMNDDTAVKKLRSLRLYLHKLANQALSNIIGYALLANLPFAHHWSIPDQKSFESPLSHGGLLEPHKSSATEVPDVLWRYSCMQALDHDAIENEVESLAEAW